MVFESFFISSFWYLLIFVFALRKKYCINWAIALCFVQFHKNSRIQHFPTYQIPFQGPPCLLHQTQKGVCTKRTKNSKIKNSEFSWTLQDWGRIFKWYAYFLDLKLLTLNSVHLRTRAYCVYTSEWGPLICCNDVIDQKANNCSELGRRHRKWTEFVGKDCKNRENCPWFPQFCFEASV